MNNNLIRLHSRIFIPAMMFIFSTHVASAQLIQSAVQNGDIYPLKLCNSTTCNTNSDTFSVTNTPASLACDMVTIAPDINGGFNNPWYFGLGGTSNFHYTELYGVAYSGADIDNGALPNQSGFSVHTYQGLRAHLNGQIYAVTQPLPHWQIGGGTANDPDIAVGTNYNTTLGQYRHFALAVYELNGDIFLEHYELDVPSTGIINITPPEPGATCSPCPQQYRIQLNGNSGGNCSKPRIAVWAAPSVVQGGGAGVAGTTEAIYYAVVWQRPTGDTVSGVLVYDVWGTDGEIVDAGYSGFPADNGDFLVLENSREPDVACVTAIGPVHFKAYVTSLAYEGKTTHFNGWDYNTQTAHLVHIMSAPQTAGNFQLSRPRIASPMRYDYSSPNIFDPLAVVVVNDNDGNSTNVIDKVSGFKFYHPAPFTPPANIAMKWDLSDYDNSSGFSSNNQTAIMPVVSGVGQMTANLSGYYMDYPVVFYSDYTHNGNAGTGTNNSGDLFAFGMPMHRYQVDTPNLSAGVNYWEVNYDPLDNSGPPTWSMTGTKPAFDASTAHNSGHDLLSTFYTGDVLNQITIAFNGGNQAAYSFKPGRPSGIQDAKIKHYSIYPNPATDILNVVLANGADYLLTDAIGKVVTTGKLKGDKAQLNVAPLASGMYFLTISKDGHTEKVKFVKN